MTESRIIAIDIGTSYCRSAIFRKEKTEIFLVSQNNFSTPSYIGFRKNRYIFGNAAKSQAIENAPNIIFASKRILGRTFKDPLIQYEMKFWPFKVIPTNKDEPRIQIQCNQNQTKNLSPDDIYLMLIKNMKRLSDATLCQQLEAEVVITVPSSFTFFQREAVRRAGENAGLKKIRLMNESSAAALAYNFDNEVEMNVMIFDMGGGKLDISVLTIEDRIFEVKAYASDNHLGGEDFTNRLIEYFVGIFNCKHKKDLTSDSHAILRLRHACEFSKKILCSSHQAANIELDYLFDGIDFYATISRDIFDELCVDFYAKILETVERALQDARMNKSEINEIFLVGGCTKIPKIKTILSDFFDRKKLQQSIHSDTLIVEGAAIYAAVLGLDKSDNIKNMLLLDIASHSLGIETAGGIMTPIIKRNTSIPTKASEICSTYTDNQCSIIVKVFEGENVLTKNNNSLGAFEFKNIPPSPVGVPRIQITFYVNSEGFLWVSAEDLLTGKIKTVEINKFFKVAKNDLLDEEEEQSLLERQAIPKLCDNIERCVQNLKKMNKMSDEDGGKVTEKCDEILSWFFANRKRRI